MLIIGDIAGQYNTLMALLKQCPDEEPVSVGDMIDRGPDSKKVLDFFMKNGRAIFGNHEALMINALVTGRYGHFQDWAWNGGGATVRSFGIESMPFTEEQWDMLNPYCEWIDTLPLFIQEPGLLITHAPKPVDLAPDQAMQGKDMDLWIWNRHEPEKVDGTYQVFGHNSNWGLRYFATEGNAWAACIDTSAERVLTAMQWPSKTIFQQPYLD